MTKFLALEISVFMFAAPACHFFTAGFNHFCQSFQFERCGILNNKRHTIDLVLSYGVSLKNIDPLDFSVSDHMTIVFHALLWQPAQKSAYLIRSHIFNSLSANIFFKLLDHFNGKCPKILDDLSLIKNKITKHNAPPWLSNHTRDSKRQWRKTERKWRKAQTYGILKS